MLEAEEDFLKSIGADPEGAPDRIAAVCLLQTANTTQAMENSGLPFGVRSVYVGPVEWMDEEQGDILGKFRETEDGEARALSPGGTKAAEIDHCGENP